MILSTYDPAISSLQFSDDLRAAEQVRKKILLNYSIIGAVLFIGLIIEAVTWMSIAIFVIAAFVLIYTRWYGIPVTTFETLYLQAVTKNAISYWPELQIDYNSHLRVRELSDAGIVMDTPDYFSGKNLIHGKVDDAIVRISEIYWLTGSGAAQKEMNSLTMHSFVQGMHHSPMIISIGMPANTQFEKGFTHVQLENTNSDQIHSAVLNNVAAAMQSYHRITNLAMICSLHDNQMVYMICREPSFHYFNPSITHTVFDMQPVQRYNRDLQEMIQLATVIQEKATRG